MSILNNVSCNGLSTQSETFYAIFQRELDDSDEESSNGEEEEGEDGKGEEDDEDLVDEEGPDMGETR